MRTEAVAQSYIDRLKTTQYQEQMYGANKRSRGLNYAQQMSEVFPIFTWTLDLNQVSEVIIPQVAGINT